MRVRPATAADVPGLLELERGCATAAHWSEQQYNALFQAGDGERGRLVLVADDRSESPLLAFLVANHIGSEWELENVVVAPAVRRKGLGKRLLDDLLVQARNANSGALFLEVRESNLPARALYEKSGFAEAGRRKSYYVNPVEDAILYRLPLP